MSRVGEVDIGDLEGHTPLYPILVKQWMHHTRLESRVPQQTSLLGKCGVCKQTQRRPQFWS